VGPAVPVTVQAQIEALLVPVLGLVHISQPGHVQVSVAEAASQLGFVWAVANPLGQREGLLIARQAARIILLAEDVAEIVEGSTEVADLGALVWCEADSRSG